MRRASARRTFVGLVAPFRSLSLALDGIGLHVGHDRGVVAVGLLGGGVGHGESVGIAHALESITAGFRRHAR